MKTNFTNEQLNKIKQLFDERLGSRKIAVIMNVNRSTIVRAYKQLNLDSASVKTPRFAYKYTNKCCKICKEIKLINQFRQRIKGDRISHETYCINCEKQLYKYDKNYYILNKESYKKYILKNKDKIKAYMKCYLKTYVKKRLLKDPAYKIKCKVSTAIYVALKKQLKTKNNSSSWKYLSYTPKDLKQYLENLFEPWMNWGNHGRYLSNKWNDNDPTTWKWQIDHIIPQSDLIYTSMEDDNFKKCWALSNLRPLSAKQNHHDGVNRIRHEKLIK